MIRKLKYNPNGDSRGLDNKQNPDVRKLWSKVLNSEIEYDQTIPHAVLGINGEFIEKSYQPSSCLLHRNINVNSTDLEFRITIQKYQEIRYSPEWLKIRPKLSWDTKISKWKTKRENLSYINNFLCRIEQDKIFRKDQETQTDPTEISCNCGGILGGYCRNCEVNAKIQILKLPRKKNKRLRQEEIIQTNESYREPQENEMENKVDKCSMCCSIVHRVTCTNCRAVFAFDIARKKIEIE